MAAAKTIRSTNFGKYELRLVEQNGVFYGLANGKICSEGNDRDRVWLALHDEAGKSDPRYFGYAGAKSRFLKFFPAGFQSDGYANQERDYKVAAKRKLDEVAPLEGVLSGSGYGEAVLSVFRATNMLSPFEKTKLQEILRGPDADKIVQAVAEFATKANRNTLARLEAALKPYDAAKWTFATYLPYLWQPDRHMFLKPEVTKDYAARVGHPLASVYEARLDFAVYSSLLDLASRTSDELSDLRPRDRIDIQSFIWVVGAYREEQEDV
ncbi:hypothetical protein [Leisingera caerulea]|uniref:hypothetical protein n=1 Tax=Leisingera caerulea TaxID=506591 RepID=UPI000486F577|nr:hypothetical protein [Leisingera caerulea]